MPELPEVETTVRLLRPDVVGATIEKVSVFWERTVGRPSVTAFRRGLAGRTITAVSRRAKYLVFHLDDGRLMSGHLRMTGRFTVGEERKPPHARVAMQFDDGRWFVFSDVRKFGRLGLGDTLDDLLPPLGPEPLTDALDGDWLATALRRRKRLLKPLLLDQAFVAGLGNIYVDESLHRAGLHPLRSAHTVTRSQAHDLCAIIKDVLGSAIVAEGSSFDTFYRTPEGNPGAFQDEFFVYGRDGKPCRGCGTTIKKLLVGQRGTHVCPKCQPVPRKRRTR